MWTHFCVLKPFSDFNIQEKHKLDSSQKKWWIFHSFFLASQDVRSKKKKRINFLDVLKFYWVIPTWAWMTELCVQLCKMWASVSTVYLTSWLTWTSSEKSYFCVPENRQGDKIAIPVRYAPVNCSSVHHLFSYEGSFFSIFLLYSKLGLKREALV